MKCTNCGKEVKPFDPPALGQVFCTMTCLQEYVEVQKREATAKMTVSKESERITKANTIKAICDYYLDGKESWEELVASLSVVTWDELYYKQVKSLDKLNENLQNKLFRVEDENESLKRRVQTLEHENKRLEE